MHQFKTHDGVRNSKWVSPDGHREVVFTGKGENQRITKDPRDQGTYNFFDPKKHPIGHATLDVLPYMLMGNSADDSTSIYDRAVESVRNYMKSKSMESLDGMDLADAEKKIKEFERRPITVVEDEKTKEENEKLKVLLADAEQKLAANDTGDYELKNAKATIRELDKQLSIETQEHANEQNRIRRKYQDEINRLNEQLKKQEENVRTVEIPDMKEVFRAYYQNAINAFNAMINFISGIEGDKDFYLKKSGQLVGKLYDTLEEVK